MKPFKNLLLFMPIVLGSVGHKPVETKESRIINRDKPFGSRVALSYSGRALSGLASGVRCQVSVRDLA